MSKSITMSRGGSLSGEVQVLYTRIVPAAFGDGTIYAAGHNVNNCLGVSMEDYYFTALPISSGIKFKKVYAGEKHTLAIDVFDRLWGWGVNTYGQLGLGFNSDGEVPTLIDDSHAWIMADAGFSHSIALTSGGDVYTFGRNNYGQLGIGSQVAQNTLQEVSISAATMVSCANYHTAVLLAGGEIWSCGYGGNGAMGTGGTIINNLSFVQSNMSTAVFMNCSASATLAIDSSGDLYATGPNGGLFGLSAAQYTIFRLINSAQSWEKISGYMFHSVGVANGGQLFGGGKNYYGILPGASLSYPSINSFFRIGSDTGWTDAYAGEEITIAVRNGTPYISGHNTVDGYCGLGVTDVSIGSLTEIENMMDNGSLVSNNAKTTIHVASGSNYITYFITS